ncbi:MAG TPA: glutamate--tRNA ligase [Thermoanaerobaculia bacterium]|nr:glutamate--tRNA ligase [Thermoanaerobaculia bacterium]
MTVRVRFAPSPTGHLHVGGARTAIFNWLFARRHGGAFIIRIENTDTERSTAESEEMVLGDLRWLGLQWDEGPDVGGIHGPYRQSERFDLYGRVALELIDRGHAYPCFCDEETLDRKRREAEASSSPPQYDLTCWRLPIDERKRRIDEAETPYVVRFHVPKQADAAFEADVTIEDLIRGAVTWRKESLGDFIILRSDGRPTYNFSVVVDDHMMEISHVIRAEEHLTNTHRQVLLYRAMGWNEPQFAHVSLILGEDRSKLSKRHGATSISQFAEAGHLPDAMLNYLTLLGWSPPDGHEVFTRAEAVAHFSLERVNPAPAAFDERKLRWMSGQYLRRLEPGTLRRQLYRSFEQAGWVVGGGPDAERWLDAAVEMVQSSAELTTEILPALRFLFEFDPVAVVGDPESGSVLRDPGNRTVLDALLRELESGGGPRDADQVHALAKRLEAATGRKGKALFMPMRLAVTGTLHGPELARVLPLLETGSELRGLAPIDAPAARVRRVLAALG